MGVCAAQQQRKISYSPQEIERVLDNFRMESQINELARRLKGQTQYVFEHILNNRNINKTICQTEYEFYSKQTEELNLLNSYFIHYYNYYYRIVISNIKSQDLVYFENLNLKFILELYLAMKTIKNNETQWWDNQYFYTREKLVLNRFNIYPKVSDEGRLTPFINFIFVLMKLSIKLMKNEGMTLKEKEMEFIVETRGSSLYNQIKLDFQLA